MVIICVLCNGRLDFPPPGNEKPKAGAICSSKCGHVFHNECLMDSWYQNSPDRPKSPKDKPVPESKEVSCVICLNKYRPAIFPIFPSTREITFTGIPAEATANPEVIQLRTTFDALTLKSEAIQKQLDERNKKLESLKSTIQVLEASTQEMMQQRNDAQRAFENNIRAQSKLEVFDSLKALDEKANNSADQPMKNVTPESVPHIKKTKRSALKRLLQRNTKKQPLVLASCSETCIAGKYALRNRTQKPYIG